MRVKIDKARGDHQTRRIQFMAASQGFFPGYGLDPAVLDPNIGLETELACAVDHGAVADDQVEFHFAVLPIILRALPIRNYVQKLGRYWR